MTLEEARTLIREKYAACDPAEYFADYFENKSIEFIQYSIEEDEGVYSVGYVVMSSMDEIKRIMSQDGNKGYSEWHSKDVDLVGWNNLLEDKEQIASSEEFKQELTTYSGTLKLLGETTVHITREKITYI